MERTEDYLMWSFDIRNVRPWVLPVSTLDA